MKKKTAKKLVVAKETLRSLEAPGLLGVAGATALQTNCATVCTQPAGETFTCYINCGVGGSAACNDYPEPGPEYKPWTVYCA